MGDKTGYRARFRFRVLKKLNIKDPERTVDIAGRTIRITARYKKSPICDSEWLVADARGFDTEGDARRFATNLKTAVDISSVASRLGVDTGINRATAGFGSWVKEKNSCVAAVSCDLGFSPRPCGLAREREGALETLMSTSCLYTKHGRRAYRGKGHYLPIRM